MPNDLCIKAVPSPCLIRPMSVADLPAVLVIERQCQPDPWSEAMFLGEFNNPCASVEVSLLDGELAGYLCSWLIGGELSILNLATAPQHQRRGVAAALLQGCLARAQAVGLERAWLEVRAGNAGAIALYRRFGFDVAGERKRYYADGEDALVMQRCWP